MIAKAECPRCRKKVAVKSRDPLVVFRHKDENSLWCSGNPKSVRELALDLVYALRAEHDALGEYTAELLRHSEEVVRVIEKHTAASAVTVQIMQQVTDGIHAEAEAARRA